jgi:hypothetical protein
LTAGFKKTELIKEASMKKHQLSLLSVCLIVLFFQTAMAQTTGKIAGTVYDQNSREPAIGANVFLEGLGTTAA